MGKGREPQIILKTDQRNVILEMGLGGKIPSEIKRLGREPTFLEGDVLEVAVRNGRWVLTHVPAGPRPAPPPAQQDLQKSVGEKQADSLRLLIAVGGHGAFVAAFGNRAEIVLADLNRQSPNSAARPFPQGSHSLGRCRHGRLLPRGNGARKPFPRRERARLGAAVPVGDWGRRQSALQKRRPGRKADGRGRAAPEDSRPARCTPATTSERVGPCSASGAHTVTPWFHFCSGDIAKF
jgi:hypothetical protein